MEVNRPKGLFITGAGTGVGKSAVGGALAAILRARGVNVGVMKPIETGVADPLGPLDGSDAGWLADMAGVDDPPELISPYRLLEPAAPSVAAEAEGAHFSIETINTAFFELSSMHEFVLVEGAGGIAVPITHNFLMADLALELELPILIIAPAALGAINLAVLTEHYARSYEVPVAGIILNHGEPPSDSLAERTNQAVIAGMVRCPVLGTVPYIEDLHAPGGRTSLVSAVQGSINLAAIEGLLRGPVGHS